MRVPHLLAVATIRGRLLFRSRASDCMATIQGQLLFEGGDYSRAVSIQRNTVLHNPCMLCGYPNSEISVFLVVNISHYNYHEIQYT